MPKENCNDKTVYGDFFDKDKTKISERYLPIKRDKKHKKYPYFIDGLKDDCYYTTPNLVGKKLECQSNEPPKKSLVAKTTQTLLTCHAFC